MGFTVLITGTDTGVGKTFVSIGLIRSLARMGFRLAPFKPAETGCLKDSTTGTLIPADARLLESASGTSAPLDTICPYRFSLPVAPWIAAEKANQTIDVMVLDRALAELQRTHDIVLIESAGGLLVPLAQNLNFADLARRWKIPVLVVAASRLGVLNQTLLTVRYLEQGGLPLLGCILNHPYGDSDATNWLGAIHQTALDTNGQALRRLLDYPIWEVPSEAVSKRDAMESTFDQIADNLLTRMQAGRAQ